MRQHFISQPVKKTGRFGQLHNYHQRNNDHKHYSQQFETSLSLGLQHRCPVHIHPMSTSFIIIPKTKDVKTLNKKTVINLDFICCTMVISIGKEWDIPNITAIIVALSTLTFLESIISQSA